MSGTILVLGIALFLLLATALAIGLAIAIKSRQKPQRRKTIDLPRARKLFRLRREGLEARFLTRAAQTGLPRGLIWADCDFEDEVVMARSRETGELRAFVGVAIKFEAIKGGDMEDVEAVGNLKAASAVFSYDGSEWATEGRAIFNLHPAEAIKRLHHELETVEESSNASR